MLTPDDLALIQQMINAAPTVGEGFAEPIVAGQNLLIPGIQSPNFSIVGTTGWAILKNGNAFFYNITATGTITATSLNTTRTTISAAGVIECFNAFGAVIFAVEPASDGWFVYADTGSAAQGRLLVACAGLAGSDPITSTGYAPGLTVFGANGTPVGITMPTTNPQEAIASFVATGVLSPGGGAGVEQLYAEFVGPVMTGAGIGDLVTLSLLSSKQATAGSAQGALSYISAAAVTSQWLVWGSTGIFATGVNLLTFVDKALPATPSGGAVLYSGSGHMKYVSTDGSAYNTGNQHLVCQTTTTTINTVGGTGIPNITGINVAAGLYRIDAEIFCSQGAVANAQSMIIKGPATSATATRLTLEFLPVPLAAVAASYQQNNVINAIQNSPAFAAGTFFMVRIKGSILFTGAGATFGITAACTVGADTFQVLGGSYCDLMPVT